MNGFCEQAPAKLNLFLHITGRRDDGYHLLHSLVAFADIGDHITATPAQGLSLSITGRYADQLPQGPDNLVLRAAGLLARRANVPANAHLALEKNLPVASGMGGGSADAAATLRALVRLWQLKLPRADMMTKIALELGADVPVCLESRPTIMSGVGEHLSMAPPLPKSWLVLINPNISVSTPSVFKARQGAFSQPAPTLPAMTDIQDLVRFLTTCHNDLMAPAISITPPIQNVLKALDQSPACLMSCMSGSGATCFGLFATPESATQAANVLAQNQPDWWVQSAQLCE